MRKIILAFCDGSFNKVNNEFSFGLVLLNAQFEVIKFYHGKFNDCEWIKLHNVAGELMGAIAAIQYAINNKYQKIVIFHDYLGIAKWAQNLWKRNLSCTKAYYDFIQKSLLKINIEFKHIKAHSNVKWNEIADYLAKSAFKLKTIKKPLIKI